MYEGTFPQKRYKNTLQFLEATVPTSQKILDLGVENPFSDLMKFHGYKVTNTHGEDLDFDYKIVKNYEVDAVTSFEVFEHLLAPFNVLNAIKANKLITTVPLKLWFAKAYRNKNDEWDQHFHEFEDWQFDWLLEKSGWKIRNTEKWTSPINKIGFRPILRNYVPRFYAVYAER